MSSAPWISHTDLALRLEGIVLTCWLLLATLAVSNTKFIWLLPVPWALLLLRWQASRSNLLAVARHWPIPLLASVVLAVWLVLGAAFGAPALHSRLALAAIALLWLPVAALIVGQRHAGRSIEWPLAAALLAVVVLNMVRVGHQLYGGSARPWGYTHNVLLGALMAAFALVATSLLLRSSHPRRIAYAGLGLGLALAIALASQARTPLVAGAMTLIVIALAWRPRFSRTVWAVLAAGVAIWAVATSQRWQLLIEQTLKYETATHKSSIGARIDMLRWAALHVREIPAFGFGESGLAEHMNQRYVEFAVDPGKIYRLIHMHNDILQLSFAHGLVAGVGYIVMLAAVIIGLYRQRRSMGGFDPVAVLGSAGAAAAVLLLAIAGLFDCFLYWPKVWVAMQAVLAIALALHGSDTNAARPALTRGGPAM